MINLRYKLELDEKTKKSRVGLVLGEDIVKQRKVAVKLVRNEATLTQCFSLGARRNFASRDRSQVINSTTRAIRLRALSNSMSFS